LLGEAAFGLGNAALGDERLAFADLRLTPGGQGRPDGTYPCGDAAECYD
jgi:hypothetical protein